MILDPEGEVVDQRQGAGVNANDQFRVAKERTNFVNVAFENANQRVEEAEEARIGGRGRRALPLAQIVLDVFPSGEILVVRRATRPPEQRLEEEKRQTDGEINDEVVERRVARNVVENALPVEFERIFQLSQIVVEIVRVVRSVDRRFVEQILAQIDAEPLEFLEGLFDQSDFALVQRAIDVRLHFEDDFRVEIKRGETVDKSVFHSALAPIFLFENR